MCLAQKIGRVPEFLSFHYLKNVLKLVARENMKPICRILFGVMCLLPGISGAAPVATTAGNNLTAYNSSTMGSINNNQWNSMMNSRTGTDSAPTADFGNCNALIMRCASPRCASGGCTSMDVTVPIVNGCVNSNEACKQYGSDLVQSIAAQIVANSNAKANQAAQNAAAAAAAQSSQQLAQMQQEMNMQMQQMQQQMQAQNDATVAQLQAALEEQKQMTAAAQQQVADAQIAQNAATSSGLTLAQQDAAARGVDSDLIVREQITGEIMSKLENAETALKALRDTMRDAFTYAGCDETTGSNCAGPKRVKTFKQKAMKFFDPYNDVLDELYDALITAQAVGVDITDIYMMLNGSCNLWGEYLCTDAETLGTYGSDNCVNGKSKPSGLTRGGAACVQGQAIGAEDSTKCTLNRTLKDNEEVQRNWLDADTGEDGKVRVGCASSALENSAFFRNRKKQASIDIETLERIIEQDAPQTFGRAYRGKETTPADGLKYCAIVTEEDMESLQQAVALKKLPSKKSICVKNLDDVTETGERFLDRLNCEADENKSKAQCDCERSVDGARWTTGDRCSCPNNYEEKNGKCGLKATVAADVTKSLSVKVPLLLNQTSVAGVKINQNANAGGGRLC